MPLGGGRHYKGFQTVRNDVSPDMIDYYGIAIVESKDPTSLDHVYKIGPMDEEGRFVEDRVEYFALTEPISAYNRIRTLVEATPLRRLHARCRRVYRDLKRVVEELSQMG